MPFMGNRRSIERLGRFADVDLLPASLRIRTRPCEAPSGTGIGPRWICRASPLLVSDRLILGMKGFCLDQGLPVGWQVGRWGPDCFVMLFSEQNRPVGCRRNVLVGSPLLNTGYCVDAICDHVCFQAVFDPGGLLAGCDSPHSVADEQELIEPLPDLWVAGEDGRGSTDVAEMR
jgi:hypothetical protein